jgi:hypothetical protein
MRTVLGGPREKDQGVAIAQGLGQGARPDACERVGRRGDHPGHHRYGVARGVGPAHARGDEKITPADVGSVRDEGQLEPVEASRALGEGEDVAAQVLDRSERAARHEKPDEGAVGTDDAQHSEETVGIDHRETVAESRRTAAGEEHARRVGIVGEREDGDDEGAAAEPLAKTEETAKTDVASDQGTIRGQAHAEGKEMSLEPPHAGGDSHSFRRMLIQS